MAARGNAANKMKKAEREKEDKERRKIVKDDAITEDDLIKFAEEQAAKPKDKWRDPECAGNSVSRAWMKVSAKIRDVAYGERFGSFVLFCIIIAGVLVGIQTYPGMEEDDGVKGVDAFILYVFTVETALKMMSEGLAFPAFWFGQEWKWNNFDFMIVVTCYLPKGFIPGGSSVALLRLLRLARLVKLFKKIPQLQMIVMGLAGGIKSIFYIVILLLLVFYLYAIVGMTLFQDNDPWHFRNLQTTILTLFRASTLEDWTDIMYISIFGCDKYSSVYVMPPQWTPDNMQEWCKTPQQSQFLSPVYWVTFIVVSALVMLSLFIGAVTMSMTESMEQMKEEQEEATKQRMKEKQMKKLQEKEQQRRASQLSENNLGKDATAANESRGFNLFGALGFGEDEAEKDHEHQQMTNLLVNIWDGIDLEDLVSLAADDEVSGSSLRLLWHKLSVKMMDIRDHQHFNNFVTFVILLASGMVGLTTDIEFTEKNEVWMKPVDTFILVVFIIEIIVKFIAEDLYPLRFFKSGWNCFDLLIVIGSLALSDSGSGNAVQVLRLLRLLRVLKLVKAFPQLQVIVNALMMGLSSIGFIGIILILVFYMCAIIGMMAFKDNDPWHFGNLMIAMLTLFRASTLEDWTDLMYINMYGCHKYGYSGWMAPLCTAPTPLEGENWWSTIFFVLFTLVGALVLLTLFIGVVTTSMDEAQAQQEEEKAIAAHIKQIANDEGLTDSEVDTFLKVFAMMDLDGGGTIEEEELRVALQSVGKDPTDEELAKMMHEVDEDDSGEIDPAEFIQFMVNLRKEDREKKEAKGTDGQGDSRADSKDATTITPINSHSPDNQSFANLNNQMMMTGGGIGITGQSSAVVNLQVSALTPMKTTATVGIEQNFGLPVLQSPSNDSWLDLSLDMGRSRRKLPRLGGNAKIAP